jgi:hypothetical protein
MIHVRGTLLASVAGLIVIGLAAPASADQLLTGSIASASGQKLDGVQVSSKKDGSTITTSVYTDQNGDYFFPALPDGAPQRGRHRGPKGAGEVTQDRSRDGPSPRKRARFFLLSPLGAPRSSAVFPLSFVMVCEVTGRPTNYCR